MKTIVVIPAYNEAAFIADVIRGIPGTVQKIIIVDDCSSDETGKTAEEVGDSRVTVIRHEKNRGVGGATVTGYKAALEMGAEIVVKLDADGQMNPRAIPKLIRPIMNGEADYTKGFRFHERKTLRKMPRSRLIGNLGLSFLVKVASGYWHIFDPTNGFTAIHRTALERIDLDRLSKDYFFETDMLCSLYRNLATVKDVPLTIVYGAEESDLNPLKILMQFPGRLLKAYFRRIIWRYYVVDFSAFSVLFLTGILLMLFGVIHGATVWRRNALRGVPTPTGTVMIAVVPLFLGFQMFLQAVLLDVGNIPREPLQKQ